jgi:gamma-glutamyl-gamma-aminobutyrate hydrolase PuuD
MSKKVKSVYVEDNDQETITMFQEEGWDIAPELKQSVDLVCFTGGSDVNPLYYGAHVHPTTKFNPTRDMKCTNLFKRASDWLIPKVGICRGGQFLNIKAGGKMFQDVDKHNGGRHKVFMCDEPLTSGYEMTSAHHQMMVPGEGALILGIAKEATRKDKSALGDYTITTTEEDVEIIYYEKNNSLCFQPHPEWVDGGHPCQIIFFDLIDQYLLN